MKFVRSIAFSGHFFIESNLDIPQTCLTVNESHYCNHKTLNIDTFSAGISTSVLCKWNNASVLAMCYDTRMTSLLEENAYLQRKSNEHCFTCCDVSHFDRQFVLHFLNPKTSLKPEMTNKKRYTRKV